MELRVLRYFLAIAEEENITRAADILHVTQPTLSRQIMLLEEELGTKLFTRSRYCIKLTEDGLFLKQKAEEILALADSTKKAIGHDQKEIEGEISIGCTETHGMDFLASKMAGFRRIHPKVRYNLHTANVNGIMENLEKGILEIGLITEPVDTARYDSLHMPIKENWGVIVRKDNPLANMSRVSPEDVSQQPLLIPIRREIQYTLENWFGRSFQTLDIAARYNLGRNVSVLVQNGLGIGLGFDFSAILPELRFVPLDPPILTGSVLCWKKNQRFSPVSGSFIDFMRKQ